ncbi:MAG: AI-2E family transporter [Agathobacter sp.]|nr:AI-2E family transporter [Agathobacter sp.]
MLGFAGALILVFLVIRYWEKLEGLISVGIGAATPLIIGCAMAYVINILMGFFEKWYDKIFKVDIALKIKRVVCLILAFLSLFGIVTLIINLVLPELINCIASFIRLIPGALQMVVDIVGEEQILSMFPELQNGFDLANISTQVEQLIKTVIGGVGGAVGSIMVALSSAVSVVVNIVIGLIFSLYVLLDKEGLGRRCKTLISTYLSKSADKIFYVADVLDDSFHSFIVGQCIEAVVLGTLCIIGMWIFRFPYAVMIGVFIGFTALIPIAGAYIGAAVGAIMILTVSPLQAVQFLIFIVVLQQLEGNLIYPKVVGQSIGLPGIWVLTAITVGGGVLGVGGMLLAVPIFAAGYRLIREDVEKRNKEVKAETNEKPAVEHCSDEKEEVITDCASEEK